MTMETQEDLVRLWDGRDYERARLDEEWPGLADYAAEHPQLQEAIPYEPGLIMRYHVRSMVLFAFLPVYLFLALVVVVEYPKDERLAGLAFAPFYAAFLVAGECVCFAIVGIPTTSRVLPVTIMAENGVVHFANPRESRTAELSELQWYVGPIYYYGRWRWPYPRKRAIQLIFPATSADGRKLRRRAAVCGLTDEIELYWEAFLTLAEVPGQTT